MIDYQFSFERLEVWQLSRSLAVDIYETTKLFPVEEKYSLTSQIRRAVTSISANLAEGTTRVTGIDQARFTTIAYSSLMELFSHLVISTDLGYMSENELLNYRQKIQPLSIKLANLKMAQINRYNKQQ